MTENNFIPPHSLEAEQGVIGSILIDSQSEKCQITLASLKADAFYNRAHQEIWQEAISMNRRKLNIDLLTLSDSLEQSGKLQQVGGLAYLAEAAKNTPSAANVANYAQVVRDRASERMWLRQTAEVMHLFNSRNGMSSEQKVEAAQALLAEAVESTTTGNKKGLRRIDEIASKWTAMVENRFSDPDAHRGLTTGIRDLDNMLAPKHIMRGSLFVIGARPKMGKTTVLTEIALHVADVENLPVAMFSLEMPEEQIFERMLGQASHVNTDMFYDGANDEEDWNRVYAAMARMSDRPNIWIDDNPGMTLAHIQAECRKLKRNHKRIGMIGIDYLTLMNTESAETNALAFGKITKALKNLAKELDTVIVLLTQLNRNLEERANKRPMASDSRDTGQIEQDCDYWMAIYKESIYDDSADPTLTELILRLNRHGKTGTVYVDQKDVALYPCDQKQAIEERADRKKRRVTQQVEKVLGF
ncbi:replicative DNA helicase [Mixta calida]|uniref:replicative DNA helicase n=1 Tax=Mixta calida TaxID=665913 RepID=UPI00403ADCAC